MKELLNDVSGEVRCVYMPFARPCQGRQRWCHGIRDRRRRAAPISRVYWLDCLAFLRFAQYAFIRLEMAALSDAVHVTFRFCVVLG